MSMRQIIPSAENDLKDIEIDYRIGAEVDEWCRRIAAEAHRSERPMTGPTEINIEDVFAQLDLNSADPDSSWADELGRFHDAYGVDLYTLKGRLAKRKPPWRLRLNSRVFIGLDGAVPVDVWVVYDVNPDEGTATFLWFEAYTPDRSKTGTSETPRAW